MSKDRPLPPIPRRIKHLSVNHQGFVVPFFVQWFKDGEASAFGEGAPDFRVADERKFRRALQEKRCWVCGDRLGVHLAFLIGPMCAVNKVTSEPSCHFECADYAARVCPFLTRPRMRRNEHALPAARIEAAGVHLRRNPGAACIWVTRSVRPFRPDMGEDGILFALGPPERVLWYCEGRAATRAEIEAAITSGLPALEAVAELQGGGAMAELLKGVRAVQTLLPA